MLFASALATHAQRLPPRAVDWRSALLADAHVTVTGSSDPLNPDDFGPFVEVTLGVAGKTVRGAPDFSQIEYGDLDGAAEALIPFFPGGAGGHCTGFALFHEAEAAPRLLTVLGGAYESAVGRIADGTVLVTPPIFAGFEGRCCPSGWLLTT